MFNGRKMKQGSKSVVESLINHHVDYVFGIPGAKSMVYLMN